MLFDEFSHWALQANLRLEGQSAEAEAEVLPLPRLKSHKSVGRASGAAPLPEDESSEGAALPTGGGGTAPPMAHAPPKPAPPPVVLPKATLKFPQVVIDPVPPTPLTPYAQYLQAHARWSEARQCA